MKKNLNVGQVTEDSLGMAHYLVRDIKSLESTIIPIFDKITLLTSKEFSFLQFKNCLAIVKDPSLSRESKINNLLLEKQNKCPDSYVSS